MTTQTQENDPADGGQPPQPTIEWWSAVFWGIWGVVIGALIAWLDGNLVIAALFLFIGLAIGIWGWRLLEFAFTPSLDWYRRFTDPATIDERFFELAASGESDSGEFKELLDRQVDDELFAALLGTPPILGLAHGIWLGGLGGAMLGGLPALLDQDAATSVAFGACGGTVVGVIVTSFLASTLFAILAPVGPRLPFLKQCARRALMVVSPVLILGALWSRFRPHARKA